MSPEKSVELETARENNFCFADVGFSDRNGYYQMGLSRAPVTRKTALTPQGEMVHLMLVDYPVTGKGLEYLLAAVSPGYGQVRGGIISDWVLPDEARALIEQGQPEHKKVIRHQNHEQLASYREFDASHRTKWMQVLRDNRYDPVFELVTQGEFIHPAIFTAATLAEWNSMSGANAERIQGAMFGYLSQIPKGISFSNQLEEWQLLGGVDPGLHERTVSLMQALRNTKQDVDNHNKIQAAMPGDIKLHILQMWLSNLTPQEAKAHFNTLIELIQSPYTPHRLAEELVLSFCAFDLSRSDEHGVNQLINPISGRSWSNAKEWRKQSQKVPISSQINNQQMTCDFGPMTLSINTTQVDSTGRYNVIVNHFSPEPDTLLMRPLVAFVETAKGKRFLTQEEALLYAPASWEKQDPDVMLGRIALAYFQPDVAGRFFGSMRYPQRRAREAEAGGKPNPVPNVSQIINSAQLPVWVSEYATHLLASPVLTATDVAFLHLV